MCLNWFRNFGKGENYQTKVDYAKDNLYYTMHTSEVIRLTFRDKMGYGPQYVILDRYFFTVDLAHIVWFLENDDTDTNQYIGDDGIVPSYDCDAFSIRLWGNFKIPGWSNISLGFLIIQMNTGGYHAMNIFVADDLEVWVIEPQNSTLYTLNGLIEEGWKPIVVIM